MSLLTIRTALISVSDKTNLDILARFLVKNDVKIISTGGTAEYLRKHNIKCEDVSNITEFPEILDGRVKTLHPKIFGGILQRTQDEDSMSSMQIPKIDLLIVNLYPFENVIQSQDYLKIIENIDIGGHAMLRAAAKNYQNICVISDILEYDQLMLEILENNGEISEKFRKNMAINVFNLTSYYDSIISNWFCNDMMNKEKFAIPMQKLQKLRYGENPHQNSTIFSSNICYNFEQLQGKELSYNNFNDMDGAIEAIQDFQDSKCCVIVKHANPCGIAIGDNIIETYKASLSCDTVSAFGGIVAISDVVNPSLAEEMVKTFYEVIIAPDFSTEAIEIFKQKPNLRIVKFNLNNRNNIVFKSTLFGVLMQNTDSEITSTELLPKLTSQEIFAIKCVKLLKSNAIVITDNFKMIASGTGQRNRVDACVHACEKLKSMHFSCEYIEKNCILTSDAFFPFPDCVEIAAQYGIKKIIAPSGSIRDEEVDNKAKELGINLIRIDRRHFKH